jgi:hypothetical protein
MKKFNKLTDSQLALTSAKLSAIAYIDTDITNTLVDMGFELVKMLGKVHDLSGFICKNTDSVFLVFQGTDIKDWKTIKEDLKFWHTRKNGVSYNDGFWDAYTQLCPEFINSIAIKDIDSNLLPVYITGHSLGGAIALITALNTEVFSACYTFGAPRVCGLSGLKLAKEKNIYKFIHENDIVPSLPLMIMGYTSPGQMVYITSDDDLVTGWKAYLYRITAQLIPLTKKCCFDIIEAIEDFLSGNQIESAIHITGAVKELFFNFTGQIIKHLIDNYIDALQVFVKRLDKKEEV